MDYGIRRELNVSFDEALVRLPEALKAEGFGVLTEIDVRETLKKKLNADFRRYRILGACNPPLAQQALTAELEIGLMLPCNFIVYERDDGKATVAAVDPQRTIGLVGNDNLVPLAAEVKAKIGRVLEAL